MEKRLNKRKKINLKEFLTNDKLMIALVIWIIINLLYIFVGSFLNTVNVIKYRDFVKPYYGLVIVNVIFAIYIAVKRKIKPNIIVGLIAVILVCGVVSTIFAVRKNTSLFGIGGRYEGLFSICYYFSLMYLSTFVKKEYKKIIIIAIIATGVIQTVYAIGQIYNWPHVYRMKRTNGNYIFKPEGIYQKYEIWATGFITNPNFFGSYIIMCLTYAIGLYLDSDSIKKEIVLLPVIALFMVGLLISNTTSCALAFIAITLFIIAFCIKNKKFRKLIIILLLTISLIIIVDKLGKTTLVGDVKKTSDETVSIASGDANPSFGTNRLYIWQNAVKIIPENLVHGCGIDNFYYAFEGKSLVSQDGKTYYDKVHNEYLQILITEGLVCLLAYLAMYILICIRGFKGIIKNKKVYLILPVIAYLMQAFFNISVIEVAPIFFIALGLCSTDE